MDLCVVDWKAITPLIACLIAAGTALYISNKWSKQKGAEVIAIESKNILINLEKLALIQNEIFFWFGLNAGKVDEKLFQEFKQLKDSLENSTMLLNHAITDEEFTGLLMEVLKLVRAFERSLRGYNENFFGISDIKDFSLENYEPLKKELLEYALYKKKLN